MFYSAILRLRTIPAFVKIIAAILGLITFLCTKLSEINGVVEDFCFITGVVAFSLTLGFLILFVFRVDDKVRVNWAKIELIFAIVASHTYILISTLIVRVEDDTLRAAAICGYLTVVTFLFDMCIMSTLSSSGSSGWGYY